MENSPGLNYRKLTVAQLKDELTSRGLDTAGKKSDLITRLEEHDKILAEEEEAELEGDGGEEEVGDDIGDVQQNGAEGGEESGEKELSGKETDGLTLVISNVQGNVGGGDIEQGEDNQIPLGTDINEDDGNDADDIGDHIEAEQGEEEQQAPARDDAEQTVEETLEKDTMEKDGGEQTETLADGSDGDAVQSEDKKDDGEGVVIDTVGEVDDEEFAAGLDNIGTENDDALKKEEEEKEEEEKEKPKPPTPPATLDHWFVKRLTEAKRFSSLYIHPLKRNQVLNTILIDWANKARYFVINYSRSGKGAAIMTFNIDDDAQAAKVALSAELGEDVKLENPRTVQEKDMVKDITYPAVTQFQPSRTIILQGVGEETRLEQLRDLFTSPQLLARVHDKETDYKWKGMVDYTFPEGFNEMVLVEFGSSRDAEKAVEQNKEFTMDDKKITTQLMTEFESNYATKFKEAMKTITEEENRLLRQRKKGSVMADKQRLSMCRMLSNTVKERSRYQRMDSSLPWNDRMTKAQQLSQKVLELVRALDHDTDKRVGLKMNFPEPVELMTKHTRKLHQGMMRRERYKDDKKDAKKDLKLTVKVEGDKREVGKTEEPIVIEDEDEDDGTSVTAEAKDTDRKIKVDADGGMQVERKMGDSNTEAVDMEIDSQAGDGDAKAKREHSRSKDRGQKRGGSERSDSAKRRSTSRDRKRSVDRRAELSPTPERSVKEKRKVEEEINKLTMDLRGWYSMSIVKPNERFSRDDARKAFERYGKLKEIHFASNKVFLRYAHRGEILRAIKHEFDKFKIEVPAVADKYVHPKEKERVAKLKAQRLGAPVRSTDRPREPEGTRYNERSRDRGPLLQQPIPVHDVINPAMQNAVAMQQRQQQIMLQQEMLRRQQQAQAQQQAAMAMQTQVTPSQSQGLLGAAPMFRTDQGMSHYQMPQPAVQQTNTAVPSLLSMNRVTPTKPRDRRPPKRDREPSPRRDERQRDRERDRSRDRDRDRGYERRNDRDDRKGDSHQGRSQSYDRGDSTFSSHRDRRDDRYDDRSKRMKQDDRPRGRDDYPEQQQPDDTSTVAAVLKGLSQVISSKMEEMTRLGAIGNTQHAREIGERLMNETVASMSDLPRGRSEISRSEPHYRNESGRRSDSSRRGPSPDQRDEPRRRYDEGSRDNLRGGAYNDRREEKGSLLGHYDRGGRDRMSYGSDRQDDNREVFAVQQQALQAMADPYASSYSKTSVVPSGVPPPATSVSQYGIQDRAGYPAVGGGLLPPPKPAPGLLPLPGNTQQRGRQSYDHYGSNR